MDKLKRTNFIWNMMKTFRKEEKLSKLGQSMNGIVIAQGKHPKTLTVRCWWRSFYYREKYFRGRGSSYKVHDEENFCRIGDVVRIVQAGNVSNTKHYYVSKVIHQGPRFELWNSIKGEDIMRSKAKTYTTEGEGRDLEMKRIKLMQDRIRNIKALGLFDYVEDK